MGNCALSQDGNVVSCDEKKIQVGITTIRWGDFRFYGNENKHNQKLGEIRRMIRVKNYIRIIPRHNSNVIYLDEKLNTDKIIEGDAIIYNPDQWIFLAMIHCSWMTLRDNIIENCFKKLSQPNELKALIYDGICSDHYEVGQDVVSSFTLKDEEYKKYFTGNGGKKHFDLSGLIRGKLIASGFLAKNIINMEICSLHSRFSDFSNHHFYRQDQNRAFYSYRRFGDVERNLIFTKLKDIDFFIASTTGNCPYVILYKP